MISVAFASTRGPKTPAQEVAMVIATYLTISDTGLLASEDEYRCHLRRLIAMNDPRLRDMLATAKARPALPIAALVQASGH